MRRAIVHVVAMAVSALGVVLTAWVGLAAPVALAASGASAQTQLQANKAAARRDAAHLLTLVRLPVGVSKISSAPSFTKPGQLHGTGLFGTRYSAEDSTWWTTTENPQSVIAYVKAHSPVGATVESTGSGGTPDTISADVMLTFPALGQQVFNRTLTISVITPSHGRSAIEAQSDSYWMYPRSSSERVPADVHAVALILHIGGGASGIQHSRAGERRPAARHVLAGLALSPAASELTANTLAARHDAAQHLQHVRLPGGVTRLSSEPNFARSFAVTAGPGGKYDAQDHAVWSTTATPQTIIAYVKAHPPAGSAADIGSGSGSDTKTGVTSINVQFSWPDLAGQVLNRMLTVTVVTPPHGSSVIVAQTQSSWFVPRSSAETVPSSVHAVTITLRLGPAVTGPVIKPGGHVHTSTYLVWTAARVHALVNAFNSLPTVQPSTEPLGCPLMLTGSAASELTLAFRTGPKGATVATAQVYIHRGQTWDDGGGPCNPISFWIGGRQQTALTSPTFVKRVGKLIGASIS